MDSKAVLARFDAERQALAVMDHPNIARVLDGGATAGGQPFFVMELVKGVTITQFCDERKLTPRERLELFVPVCHAIQHAHQKGVIHRDIKPSNVLIALYDDKPVPKVIDFGVAKATGTTLTDQTLMTGFGAVVGTPEYMSPEQASLNNLDIDTRSDVYSLGVLLYELLTGTTPVDRKSLGKALVLEVLRIVREVEAPRPSVKLSTSGTLPSVAANRSTEPARLRRLLQRDLDWIVLKSLEKDRARRYESANGLASDLQRYLSGDAVQAHPPSAAYRLRKFARKHRALLAVTAAFAALLIGATVVSSLLAVKAKQAEEAAEEKRTEADERRTEADGLRAKAEAMRDQLSRNVGLYRGVLWGSDERLAEVELLAAGLQVDAYLSDLKGNMRVGLLQLARTHYPLAASPGGRHIQFEMEDGKAGKMTVPDTFADQRRALREFVAAAVLLHGQQFAPLLPPVTHDGLPVRAAFLGPAGERLLTLGNDHAARLWDPATGRPVAVLRRADEVVFETGFSPDGATAFTHAADGVIRMWDPRDGRFRAATDPRPERLKAANAGPPDSWNHYASLLDGVTRVTNDRLLAPDVVRLPRSSPRQGAVELWDTRTGVLVARLDSTALDAESYTFFGDGRWVVAREPHGPKQSTLHVFSAATGRPVARLPHAGLGPLPLSPSGRVVATSSEDDRVVRLWDTATWQQIGTGAVGGKPNQMTADDCFAFTGGSDLPGPDVVYRVGAIVPIATLPGVWQRRLGDIVLLDNGQVYDTRTWQRLPPPPGCRFHPELARFAPDGRFVPVVNPWTADTRLLDTSTGKAVSFDAPEQRQGYRPGSGWSSVWCGRGEGRRPIYRLPPPDRLTIPPDLLELWSQVAVRGHLTDDGAFEAWDEPTWERKRGELAARPAPWPDFPFPGRVATDRLHWLRETFAFAATAEEQLRLARELLRQAEAAGDRDEAVHWRREIERREAAVVPTVAPPPREVKR